jgi:hypothetical protein
MDDIFNWMDLTDEELGKHGSSDCVHHRFGFCPVCGRLNWKGGSLVKNENLPTISCEQDQELCALCNEVSERNPEVVEWIGIILNRFRHDLLQQKARKEDD